MDENPPLIITWSTYAVLRPNFLVPNASGSSNKNHIFKRILSAFIKLIAPWSTLRNHLLGVHNVGPRKLEKYGAGNDRYLTLFLKLIFCTKIICGFRIQRSVRQPIQVWTARTHLHDKKKLGTPPEGWVWSWCVVTLSSMRLSIQKEMQP